MCAINRPIIRSVICIFEFVTKGPSGQKYLLILGMEGGFSMEKPHTHELQNFNLIQDTDPTLSGLRDGSAEHRAVAPLPNPACVLK